MSNSSKGFPQEWPYLFYQLILHGNNQEREDSGAGKARTEGGCHRRPRYGFIWNSYCHGKEAEYGCHRGDKHRSHSQAAAFYNRITYVFAFSSPDIDKINQDERVIYCNACKSYDGKKAPHRKG